MIFLRQCGCAIHERAIHFPWVELRCKCISGSSVVWNMIRLCRRHNLMVQGEMDIPVLLFLSSWYCATTMRLTTEKTASTRTRSSFYVILLVVYWSCGCQLLKTGSMFSKVEISWLVPRHCDLHQFQFCLCTNRQIRSSNDIGGHEMKDGIVSIWYLFHSLFILRFVNKRRNRQVKSFMLQFVGFAVHQSISSLRRIGTENVSAVEEIGQHSKTKFHLHGSSYACDTLVTSQSHNESAMPDPPPSESRWWFLPVFSLIIDFAVFVWQFLPWATHLL